MLTGEFAGGVAAASTPPGIADAAAWDKFRRAAEYAGVEQHIQARRSRIERALARQNAAPSTGSGWVESVYGGPNGPAASGFFLPLLRCSRGVASALLRVMGVPHNLSIGQRLAAAAAEADEVARLAKMAEPIQKLATMLWYILTMFCKDAAATKRRNVPNKNNGLLVWHVFYR